MCTVCRSLDEEMGLPGGYGKNKGYKFFWQRKEFRTGAVGVLLEEDWAKAVLEVKRQLLELLLSNCSCVR